MRKEKCNHEWLVYSTAIVQGWLLLFCARCGIEGRVKDSSIEEWKEAFYAPSHHYPWKGPTERVVEVLP